MGKSTIMVIFNSYAKLREGTTTKISSKAQQRPWLASGFDLQKPPAKWFANSKNMDGIETIQKNDQDIQDWVNSPTGSKPYKYRDDCCRSFNKKSLKKSSRLGVPLATLPITVFPELSSDWEKIISKITSSHPAVLDWIFSHLKIKTTTLNDYQIVGNFWEKIHYKTTNHPAIGISQIIRKPAACRQGGVAVDFDFWDFDLRMVASKERREIDLLQEERWSRRPQTNHPLACFTEMGGYSESNQPESMCKMNKQAMRRNGIEKKHVESLRDEKYENAYKSSA